MKLGNAPGKLVVMMLVGLASGAVLADHGHFGGHSGGRFGGHFDGHFGHHHDGHFGVFVGAPLFWGWDYWDYPPYYYYPPNVAVESSPPVYIEQGSGAAPYGEGGYWYYCPEKQSYYPYVRTCPSGWQRVAPEPPP